jgi:hypothetical protein
MPQSDKDPRYKGAQVMIEMGKLTTLTELFMLVPKSVVLDDMHVSYVRLKKLIGQPVWPDDVVEKLANVLEVPFYQVLKLIKNEARNRNGKGKKSPKRRRK